jgi:hypothetical protein
MDPVAGSRQSAYNAKRAWAVSKGRPHNNASLALLKKGSMPNANYANMRSKISAAARSSYAQIKAELMAIKEEDSCPSVSNADVEFLAFAISQLMSEEQIEMISENTGAAGGWQANGSQGGGARYKQKGGALGQAIANFFRSLCGRGAAYARTGNQQGAANVDAVARAIDATSHGDITRTLIVGMTSAGAVGTMLTGQNGMATLALTALNIVRSVLPDPGTILANTYSGIVAWGPVGGALAPVLANLAIIYACFIAIKETNAFVFSGARQGLAFLSTSDYQGFLVELCNRIFSKLMELGAGSIQARAEHVANVRRTIAANRARGAAAAAGAGGGGGANNVSTTRNNSNSPRPPRQVIEAAVRAASPGLAPIFRAAHAQVQVASGTGLLPNAGGGGAAAGPLPTITEEQAEDAADAATVAGEEAEAQSQRGPAAAAAGAEGGGAAAEAEAENSQAAGFEGMELPMGNQPGRNELNFNSRTSTTRMGAPVNRGAGVPGPASGAPGLSAAALAMGAGGAAASAPAPVAAATPSGRGAKRTLTAAAASATPGGGGGGGGGGGKRPSKRGKGGGKSRRQHGGRRNQKKTRKNRK